MPASISALVSALTPNLFEEAFMPDKEANELKKMVKRKKHQ